MMPTETELLPDLRLRYLRPAQRTRMTRLNERWFGPRDQLGRNRGGAGGGLEPDVEAGRGRWGR